MATDISVDKVKERSIKFRIVSNRRIRAITSDWDNLARKRINEGIDFRITEEGKTDTDTNPGMYSIHSPLYGTDYHDDHAFEDRWSCECGYYIGKNFKNKVCPKCGYKVQFIDIDMSKLGWIILDKDVVINTTYFKKIKSFIGGKIFPEIIRYKDITDREETANNPFDGIGMIEFHERFDEIMAYYYKRHASKPKKREQYMFIMTHSNQVFAHAIPVYSSHLRPFVVRGEEIRYTDDDVIFRRIFTNHKMLNDKYELERRLDNAKKRKTRSTQYLRREHILFAIQMDLDKLWDFSFETIKKKTGQIRDKILGGRMNNSARNVIVPDKHLRADQIQLGYTTFLELYKLEIVSILTNIYQMPHPQAWRMVGEAAIIFNDQIYKIMQYMVEKHDCLCEINRNPTINYGSQLVLRIVHISPDINDHCLVLPEAILAAFNADFDGDVLNINSLKIDSIREEYNEGLNPMYNIFINRNDGKYNASAGLFKDQAIGLYCFANI